MLAQCQVVCAYLLNHAPPSSVPLTVSGSGFMKLFVSCMLCVQTSVSPGQCLFVHVCVMNLSPWFSPRPEFVSEFSKLSDQWQRAARGVLQRKCDIGRLVTQWRFFTTSVEDLLRFLADTGQLLSAVKEQDCYSLCQTRRLVHELKVCVHGLSLRGTGGKRALLQDVCSTDVLFKFSFIVFNYMYGHVHVSAGTPKWPEVLDPPWSWGCGEPPDVRVLGTEFWSSERAENTFSLGDLSPAP